jgi:hypothetical protein
MHPIKMTIVTPKVSHSTMHSPIGMVRGLQKLFDYIIQMKNSNVQ